MRLTLAECRVISKSNLLIDSSNNLVRLINWKLDKYLYMPPLSSITNATYFTGDIHLKIAPAVIVDWLALNFRAWEVQGLVLYAGFRTLPVNGRHYCFLFLWSRIE
jgi:hypothetical protein